MNLIPYPLHVETVNGTLPLGANLVCDNPALTRAAILTSREMEAFSAHKPFAVTSAAPSAGDIVLTLSGTLAEEEYTLDTTGPQAMIAGGSVRAVLYGTVSLMQILQSGPPDKLAAPRLKITDRPACAYRSLLIDLGRQFHRLSTIESLVELCRWYKIKYLHLHFTDWPLFTFQSDVYPEIATKDAHYTKAELEQLEIFSQERGVTIIPEFDIPGHASATLEENSRFSCTGDRKGNVLCPSNPQTIEFAETIIGELSAIFAASPYFHIGADEVDMKAWETCANCRKYRAEHGIGNVDGLYRDFIIRMNEAVKRHGKQTIVWEGFGKNGIPEIPRDIIVAAFESLYNPPDQLLQEGYTIINAAWRPLYVAGYPKINFPLREIFEWNYNFWNNWVPQSAAYPNGIQLPENRQVIGAELCSWEQAETLELPMLKQRLAAMSEHIWNPASPRSYEEFLAALAVTDDRINLITVHK